MLSAALTFGLYIVGHFNADLKQLRAASSIRARLPGSRAGCTTCCPICRPFDVKTEVVHGLAGSRRVPRHDDGVRR